MEGGRGAGKVVGQVAAAEVPQVRGPPAIVRTVRQGNVGLFHRVVMGSFVVFWNRFFTLREKAAERCTAPYN